MSSRSLTVARRSRSARCTISWLNFAQVSGVEALKEGKRVVGFLRVWVLGHLAASLAHPPLWDPGAQSPPLHCGVLASLCLHHTPPLTLHPLGAVMATTPKSRRAGAAREDPRAEPTHLSSKAIECGWNWTSTLSLWYREHLSSIL